jgi:aminoglycoside phosphotransferase (APT) family kinase protein
MTAEQAGQVRGAAGGADAAGAGRVTPEPALQHWLAAHLGTDGPFEIQPISGGNSNETALLRAPSGRWILRRPPAAAISATANDLGREFRVLTALAGGRSRRRARSRSPRLVR